MRLTVRSKNNEKNIWLDLSKLKGLCHACLTSDVELIKDKGQIICMDCYHRKYKQSSENMKKTDNPTLNDLKQKWERK